MKTWFVPDLLSSIPFDIIGSELAGNVNGNGTKNTVSLFYYELSVYETFMKQQTLSEVAMIIDYLIIIHRTDHDSLLDLIGRLVF